MAGISATGANGRGEFVLALLLALGADFATVNRHGTTAMQHQHRDHDGEHDDEQRQIQLCGVAGCRKSTFGLFCDRHRELHTRVNIDVDGEPTFPDEAA
jgi:hypothetical protein